MWLFHIWHKGFIRSRPVDGILGRRSIPPFNFTDAEIRYTCCNSAAVTSR
ncbi:hypothetical protein HMY34_17175 [Thiothrix subterranea]|nr:hypothetical protein [Thiothrix subterranea]QQZ27264.1 hypothetical protein HMY34_17175 [Thiothrix subterranea]